MGMGGCVYGHGWLCCVCCVLCCCWQRAKRDPASSCALPIQQLLVPRPAHTHPLTLLPSHIYLYFLCFNLLLALNTTSTLPSCILATTNALSLGILHNSKSTYPSSPTLALHALQAPRPLRRLPINLSARLTSSSSLPHTHHTPSQQSCAESSDTSTTSSRRTGSSSSTPSSTVRGLARTPTRQSFPS